MERKTYSRFLLAVLTFTDCHDRGLEADQKVIAAHGCYAMTATTALTAQNTQGVYGIHEIPSEFVKKQIDACASDVGVDVVKTGIKQFFFASICFCSAFLYT